MGSKMGAADPNYPKIQGLSRLSRLSYGIAVPDESGRAANSWSLVFLMDQFADHSFFGVPEMLVFSQFQPPSAKQERRLPSFQRTSWANSGRFHLIQGSVRHRSLSRPIGTPARPRRAGFPLARLSPPTYLSPRDSAVPGTVSAALFCRWLAPGPGPSPALLVHRSPDFHAVGIGRAHDLLRQPE